MTAHPGADAGRPADARKDRSGDARLGGSESADAGGTQQERGRDAGAGSMMGKRWRKLLRRRAQE